MSKKECPLKSGYDVEFLVNAGFLKDLLNAGVKEYLPLYEGKITDKKLSNIVPYISNMDILDVTLLAENNGTPYVSCKCKNVVSDEMSPIPITMNFDLKITFKIDRDSLKLSIGMLNIRILLGLPGVSEISIPESSTLSYDYTLKIPESLKYYVDGDIKMLFIKGDNKNCDVFAFLANLNLGVDVPAEKRPIYDVSKTQSFLTKGQQYAMGFNPHLNDKFSLVLDKFVRNSGNMDKRVKIKKVYVENADQCLKMVIKGKYDAKYLIDSLDPEFCITTKLELSIKEKKLNVDCSTDTKIEKNFLYNIVIFFLGALVPPLAGLTTIIAIHANSFIKVATDKLRKDISDGINDELSAPDDYSYLKVGHVAKMTRSDKPVTHINCFPNEPISLFRTSSDSILYDNNFGVQLNYDSIIVSKEEGVIIRGGYDSLSPFTSCNEVDLVADNGNGLLTYANKNGKRENITYKKAKEYIKETDRLNRRYYKNTTSGYVRDAVGKLPLVILSKPIAVRKKGYENVMYKFDNGLRATTQDIIKYIEQKLIIVDGVEIGRRLGKKHLRTSMNFSKDDNLDNLPEF